MLAPAGQVVVNGNAIIQGTVVSSKLTLNGKSVVKPQPPPSVSKAASANPNPVGGTATNLSVLGAGNDGSDAYFTYTWTATGPAPVAFSVNGSANGANAARATVATFAKAGVYNFQATIQDFGGLTTTSSVVVTVTQTLTSATISPATALIAGNATQQFAVAPLDQFANPIGPMAANFTWTVAGGGTISSTGLFTSGGVSGGPFAVTATSETVIATATVSVDALPPVVSNQAPTGFIKTNTPTISASYLDPPISATQAGSGVNLNSVTLFVDGVAAVNPAVTATGISYTPQTALAEGPHAITLALQDNVGNATTVGNTWSLFVDTVKPVFTSISPANGAFTNNPLPKFSAHYTDPGGANASGIFVNGVMASLDGKMIVNGLVGDPDPASGLVFQTATALSEGPHRFAVVIADNAGNVNATATVVTVDLTPPVVSGATPADGTYIRNARPLISASYLDTLSGVNVASVVLTVDGVASGAGLSARTDGVSFTPASDQAQGAHQVVLQVADNAGNLQTATWNYSVDTIPPVISNLSPTGGGAGLSTRTNNPRPVFSGTFSDSGSGVDPASIQIQLDGTDVTAQIQLAGTEAHTTFTFQPADNLTEATHTLIVQIADFAGNSTSAQTLVTIDLTPPAPPVATTITIDQNTAQFFGPTEADVVAIVASVQGAHLDFALIGSWSAQVSRTDPNNDNFTLTVQLMDSAGNISQPSVFNESFLPLVVANPINISKLEALNPATYDNTTATAYFNKTTVNVVCEASGGTAPLTVTIGGQTGTNNAGQFTATLTLPEGITDVIATVTDANGQTLSADILVGVDLTPPVLTIDTLTDGASDTTNTPITALTTAPVGFLFLNGLSSGGSMAVRHDAVLPRNVFSADTFGINGELTDAVSGVAATVQVDIRETDANMGDETFPYYDYTGQTTPAQISAIMQQPTVSSSTFSVTAAPITGGDQNRVTFNAASLASGLAESIRMGPGNTQLYKIYYVTLTAADKAGNTSALSFWMKVDKTAPTLAGPYFEYSNAPIMAGVVAGDLDVLKVGDSGTPLLTRGYVGGPWVFPAPANLAHLTLEDIAGNQGNATVQFVPPVPQIPIATLTGEVSYFFSNACAPQIASQGGLINYGPGITTQPLYDTGYTFDPLFQIDGNNYAEIPPSWDTNPRQHTITVQTNSPLPALASPQTPGVQSFVAQGLPNIHIPFYPGGGGGPVPPPPNPTITINSGGVANGLADGTYTLNFGAFGTIVAGYNRIGAQYGPSWNLSAGGIQDLGPCPTRQFGSEMLIAQDWEASEFYSTTPIDINRKVIGYSVVPDTFAANAGQIVHIRGWFGSRHAIGDQVSVSFAANGGSGTINIISDPTQPSSSNGIGHIIAEDLQNFTAWQTVEVVLDDSPDAHGIFDVTVNGTTLKQMVAVLQMYMVNVQQKQIAFAPEANAANEAAFSNAPGAPGGNGGFGGPPENTTMQVLSDPFKLANVVLNENAAPRTITFTLNSNVSTFSQAFTLTETADGTNFYQDPTGSQQVSIVRDSAHNPAAIDDVEVFFISSTFGWFGTKDLVETGLNTEVYESEHATMTVKVASDPTQTAVATMVVTLNSDLASKAGMGSVTETLSQTTGNVFVGPTITLNAQFYPAPAGGQLAMTAIVSTAALSFSNLSIDAVTDPNQPAITLSTAALTDPANATFQNVNVTQYFWEPFIDGATIPQEIQLNDPEQAGLFYQRGNQTPKPVIGLDAGTIVMAKTANLSDFVLSLDNDRSHQYFFEVVSDPAFSVPTWHRAGNTPTGISIADHTIFLAGVAAGDKLIVRLSNRQSISAQLVTFSVTPDPLTLCVADTRPMQGGALTGEEAYYIVTFAPDTRGVKVDFNQPNPNPLIATLTTNANGVMYYKLQARSEGTVNVHITADGGKECGTFQICVVRIRVNIVADGDIGNLNENDVHLNPPINANGTFFPSASDNIDENLNLGIHLAFPSATAGDILTFFGPDDCCRMFEVGFVQNVIGSNRATTRTNNGVPTTRSLQWAAGVTPPSAAHPILDTTGNSQPVTGTPWFSLQSFLRAGGSGPVPFTSYPGLTDFPTARNFQLRTDFGVLTSVRNEVDFTAWFMYHNLTTGRFVPVWHWQWVERTNYAIVTTPNAVFPNRFATATSTPQPVNVAGQADPVFGSAITEQGLGQGAIAPRLSPPNANGSSVEPVGYP